MSLFDDSLSLRAHVDAAVDPIYEQLFAMLDLLLVGRATGARALELHETLRTQLADLDHGDHRDRQEVVAENETAAGSARRWWS